VDNFHKPSALRFDGNTSVPKRHKATVAADICVPQENSVLYSYNKSFIDQACLLKMVGYWFPFFLRVYGPRLGSILDSIHKLAKKEIGLYPTILTSCLVSNPYLMLCVCFRILYNLLNIGTEQYIHQSLYADRTHASAGKEPSFNPVANMVFNLHRLLVI